MVPTDSGISKASAPTAVPSDEIDELGLVDVDGVLNVVDDPGAPGYVRHHFDGPGPDGGGRAGT
jgi:hypothetical protein